MKNSARTIILVTLPLAILWGVLSHIVADGYYKSSVNELVAHETQDAQEKAGDLADSIRRNLHYLSGIPDFLSNGQRVYNAVSRFNQGDKPSALPYEVRKKLWSDDPVLNDLNRAMEHAQTSLNADLILMLDASGDCIAAGNWNTPGSPIGTNFAEREFFKQNKTGQRGMQYAVGKSTHIAGLYFSSPVMVGSKFAGAVIAKANIDKLSFLTKQVDAFVTDKNGVILLAHDKPMEMMALPNAPLRSMSQQDIINHYQRNDFQTLQVVPWGNGEFIQVQRIQGEDVPHVLATLELPEYGLTVNVENELPELPLLEQERFWVPLWISLIGSLLIMIGGVVTYHLQIIRRGKRSLHKIQSRLSAFLHTSMDGVIGMDVHGNITVWNDAAEKIFGWHSDEVLGKLLHSVIIPERYREQHAHGLAHFNSTGEAQVLGKRIEIIALHRDGREIPIELAITLAVSDGKHEFGAFVRDISRRKLAEEQAELAAKIYQSSTEAITVTDENNCIVNINPAFTRITGYTLEEVSGKKPSILKSGEHDAEFYREMWQALLNEGGWQGEIWDRRKNGELYAKWATISTIRHPDNSVYRYVAQFSDITEKKQKDAIIQRQASYDALTGLPNRRLFQDRMEQEIKKANRTGLPLALLFLDLDRFKEINDTLGHAKGDLLLVEAARRISECVRETDTVARLGGDEFTVILPEFGDQAQLERIARGIIGALATPFDLGDGHVGYISVSIGITLYPDDAQNFDGMVKHADQAMYAAKALGRNCYSYFTASMQQGAQEKLALTNDLRHALARGELHVYYQPIVDLANGEIAKAEALLRWMHPERGIISPVVFIPLAEELGLIREIGEWVFHEAINSIEQWRKQTGSLISVSVNKSPIQFDRDEQHSTWMSRLEAAGLPGRCITVEITEGLLIKSSATVKERLLEFRNRGIEVSLDDFGTGFSSLSYLKQFDVDYLKIDRSFINSLIEDASDRALTEAIIVMAHKLGIKTIAEGVETIAQRDLLTAFGCDYAQGFLYSHAVPPEEFVKMIKGNVFKQGKV